MPQLGIGQCSLSSVHPSCSLLDISSDTMVSLSLARPAAADGASSVCGGVRREWVVVCVVRADRGFLQGRYTTVSTVLSGGPPDSGLVDTAQQATLAFRGNVSATASLRRHVTCRHQGLQARVGSREIERNKWNLI